MQTPLCNTCLESKKLCNLCQEKLKNNEISKKEVNVLRYVYKLSTKTRSLRDIKIVKAIDCDVLLIPIEGTSKYIPQAEKFINIVQPKIIIPMHYWSETYKKDFFDYLFNQKDKKYKIINPNTSEFIYTNGEKTDSIYVININPSEFNNKK